MEKNEGQTVNVAAGIIYRRGLILAMQRPEGKPFAGYWEFPGGKVEGAETPAQTLARELAEELGIDILKFHPYKIVSHYYDSADFLAKIHFFIVESFSGEPVSLENANLRWIELEKALELDFLPPDIRVLHSLQRARPDNLA